jgi:hypothetical protein
MAERVPIGGRGQYPTTDLPSAVDGPPKSQFADRSEFSSSRNIHRHASPLGENSRSVRERYEAADDTGKRAGRRVDPVEGQDKAYPWPRSYSRTDGSDLYGRGPKQESDLQARRKAWNSSGKSTDESTGSKLGDAVARGEDPWKL